MEWEDEGAPKEIVWRERADPGVREEQTGGAVREIPRLSPGPAHARSHASSHLLEEEPAGFGTSKGHIYGLARAAAVRIQKREGQCLREFVGPH